MKNNIDLYDQEQNEKIAEMIEAYVDEVKSLLILEGKNKKDVKKSIKIVKKAINNLREGKPEKVYNMEKFDEYISEGSFNDYNDL